MNPHEIEFLASESVAKSLVSNIHSDNNVTIFPGTLRDYFAGQALVGFLAGLCTTASPADLDADLIARCCRIQADAMIKAREES